MTERTRSTSFYGTPIPGHPKISVQGTAEHGFPAWPAYTPITQPNNWETKETTDVVTSSFHTRINRGEIINNPFSTVTIRETARAVGTFEHVYRTSSKVVSCSTCTPATSHYRVYKDKVHAGMFGSTTGGGYLPLDSSVRASKRQAVIDLAVTQAHANIDTSEILGLASAAESRKTVESVRAILWRVFKIARNVRKLNLRGVLDELSPKELADRYMEARYAIRPLMYDIRGITKALEATRRYERRTFRGYAEDSYTCSPVTVSNIPCQPMAVIDLRKETDYVVSARAGVMCDCDITGSSIFGLDQIAETAWELVPFSFVIDWFANVGDTIAAHTPNAGVTQRASFVTVKEHLTQRLICTDHRSTCAASGYVLISITSPKGTMQKEELVLERIVDPVLYSWPRVDISLDGYKLTDLGIILRRVLR